LEKHLKQQIYHYMASVTKTNSLAKGSTWDLEKFNYNDDLISMDEMNTIEDLNSDSKWLAVPCLEPACNLCALCT
jgi:hypothetical protein